jgi:hypothetical protein
LLEKLFANARKMDELLPLIVTTVGSVGVIALSARARTSKTIGGAPPRLVAMAGPLIDRKIIQRWAMYPGPRFRRHNHNVIKQIGGSCYLNASINCLKDGSLREAIQDHCEAIIGEYDGHVLTRSMAIAKSLVDEVRSSGDLGHAVSLLRQVEQDVPANILRCALFLQILGKDSDGSPSSAREAHQYSYTYIANAFDEVIDQLRPRGVSSSAAAMLSILTGLVDSDPGRWLDYCKRMDAERSRVCEIELVKHRILVQINTLHSSSMPALGDAECGVLHMVTPSWSHAVSLVRDVDGSAWIGESGLMRNKLRCLGTNTKNYIPIDTYFQAVNAEYEDTEWCVGVALRCQADAAVSGGGLERLVQSHATGASHVRKQRAPHMLHRAVLAPNPNAEDILTIWLAVVATG